MNKTSTMPNNTHHVSPLIKVSTLILFLLTIGCNSEASSAIEEGNIAFDNGQYTEALHAYEKVRSESKHIPQVTYNSANVYYRSGDYLTARESYEEAILGATEEMFQDGLFNLGNTLYKLEDLELAIESYKELLKINHQDIDAKYNLEIALLHMRELENDQDQQDESSQDSQQNPANPDFTNASDSPQGGEPPENPLDESESSYESGQLGTEDQTTGQSNEMDMEPKSEISEEQARQILEMIGNQTNTLQSQLGNRLEVAGNPRERDW